jgi:hypothetical protein
MNTKLLVSIPEVANRLSEFGVTKEQLIEVVYKGVEGRNECTPNHPASMAGTRCWGDATRALRDLFLRLEGWAMDNTDNIASVINRKLGIKIAVTNASSGTGIEWAHPQPIREKGDGAQRAFENQTSFNQILQVELDGTKLNMKSLRFYYLCIFCGCETVRAELLHPVLSDDGMFQSFHERIAILGEGDHDGGPRIQKDPEGPEGDSGFDIQVTRKQA